ncbi:MAG: M48 family metallopeptidase [Nevskiales bacterium]
MSYVPKLPDDRVNIPQQHPLIDLAVLLTGALAVVLGIYWLLGVAVNYAVDRLPAGFEQRLAAKIDFPADEDSKPDPREPAAQAVLAKLLRRLPAMAYPFRLSVADDAQVNAFAVPGGHIVLLRGLLDAVRSENELAMVLSHELGHYAQRDHLRALGRGLVLAVLSAVLLGQDSALSGVAQGSLGVAHANYSRGQEASADRYGIELLQKTYGHVGGATDFFERLAVEDGNKHGPTWLSSHPLSAARVRELRAHILTRRYPEKTKLPWPP